jgi:hypothetical protein
MHRQHAEREQGDKREDCDDIEHEDLRYQLPCFLPPPVHEAQRGSILRLGERTHGIGEEKVDSKKSSDTRFWGLCSSGFSDRSEIALNSLWSSRISASHRDASEEEGSGICARE